MNTNASSRLRIFVFCILLVVLAGCAAGNQSAPANQSVPGNQGSAVEQKPTEKPKTSVFSGATHRLKVVGNPMDPTIKEQQTVTYKDVQVSDLKHGDIVVFQKDNMGLIRRLIGLPGETVEIQDGVVYVNDQALEEAYISNPQIEALAKITLASDEYFVMGDNRSNGNDSRLFGPVKAADIAGRVDVKP